MKVSKSFFLEFIIVFLCSISTIILFYSANKVDNNTYLIAFSDAFFKSLTMVIVISYIESIARRQCISGATVFLLVTVLYNQNSIIKYAVDSLYDGAIDDISIRFLGSCYVNLIILFGAYLWKRKHQRNKEFDIDKNYIYINQIQVKSSLLWLVVILYLGAQFYFLINSKMLFTNSSTRVINTFLTALEYICFTLISINVKRTRKGINLFSLLPIGAVGIFLLYATIVLGTKQIVIRAAIVIVCALIFQEKIRINEIKYFFYFSPLILQGITSLSELVSGRFSQYNSYWMLRYHAFRYDLSDFAMTFATRMERNQYCFDVVKEAFLYVLPSFIYKDKQNVLPMYNASVQSVGLEGYPMDYNDTIFSIGGQIGGVLGISLVFIFIILFHEWFSKMLMRLNLIGPAIMMTFFGYFSYVESDLFMFLYLTRDLIVYFAVAWLIFKILLKKVNYNSYCQFMKTQRGNEYEK